MKKLITSSPPQCFWINNGPIVCNLEELHLALKKEVSDEQFFHHVTIERNDFEKWIRVTLLDDACAHAVKQSPTRKTAIQALWSCLKSYEE